MGYCDICDGDERVFDFDFLGSFRLIFAPIIVSGDDQRNASGNLLRLTVSIPRADCREVLSDESVPLVEFIRENVGFLIYVDQVSRFHSFLSPEQTRGLPERPEITINLKQITHTLRGSGGKRLEAPKTDIT